MLCWEELFVSSSLLLLLTQLTRISSDTQEEVLADLGVRQASRKMPKAVLCEPFSSVSLIPSN